MKRYVGNSMSTVPTKYTIPRQPYPQNTQYHVNHTYKTHTFFLYDSSSLTAWPRRLKHYDHTRQKELLIGPTVTSQNSCSFDKHHENLKFCTLQDPLASKSWNSPLHAHSTYLHIMHSLHKPQKFYF